MICSPHDTRSGEMSIGDTQTGPNRRLPISDQIVVHVTLVPTRDCTHFKNLRVGGP